MSLVLLKDEVLQLLLSVQDHSGQGQFFSTISAFTHGMLFHTMSRGKNRPGKPSGSC